jgi:rhamnogalacturonan endolyase
VSSYVVGVAMGVLQLAKFAVLAACAVAAPFEERRAKPKSFLKELGNSTWVIGNTKWNATQGRQYANKLWYKGKDRVGAAVGHYVSYSTFPVLHFEREGADVE